MPIIDPEIERLAQNPPNLDHIGDADMDRIASLAMRITRVMAERSGIPVESIHARSYSERTSTERAVIRAGARRVIQALILLGWIEFPVLELPGAS